MAWMNGSRKSPAPAVQASTVILVRGLEGKLQVYLLRRSSKSGFMPGNYVFPGGTVDPLDRDAGFWRNRVDMTPAQITSGFGRGMDLEDASAHAIAAIRETFEEACLLLALNSGGESNKLEGLRRKNLEGGLRPDWLRDLVLSGGWILNFSAFWRWSHWITPEIRTRRYDTRFFLAFMPGDQECRPDHRETTHGIWLSPQEALAGNLAGELPLSPPALVTLHELLEYPRIGALEREVETRPWGLARIPRLIPMDGGALLLLPWDPAYDEREIKPSYPEKRPAPVGRPFSRLWYVNGIWQPVSP